LRESNEEALIGSEAVNRLQVLVFRLFLPRDVRQQRAAEIGDVFARG
jgi:hypothetical protein